MSVKDPKTLALHDTLEFEELLVFQSNGLMKLKEASKKINDAKLRKLYTESIQDLELNISELIHFTTLYLYVQTNKSLK
jgi:spore coat protein F